VLRVKLIYELLPFFCFTKLTKLEVVICYLYDKLLYPFKEITDGDVKFVNNSLCNVEDILWKGEILQDKKQKVTIENYKNLRPCKQVLNADFDHWC